MPLRASAEELRLALVAVIGAASTVATSRAARCAEIMDEAAELAASTSDTTLRRAGAVAPSLTRLRAVGVIGAVCANCGACERGRPQPTAARQVQRER